MTLDPLHTADRDVKALQALADRLRDERAALALAVRHAHRYFTAHANVLRNGGGPRDLDRARALYHHAELMAEALWAAGEEVES